jgi:hypothetical protein
MKHFNMDFGGKKKFLSMLSLLVCAFVLMSYIPAEATERTLKEGDYIKFGTYHGASILWRVVDFDADQDPMLITDQIITNKPFELHSNNEGCWEDSYIRAWLNSENGEGQVKYGQEDMIQQFPLDPWTWNVGQLKNEAGFLSTKNFTPSEVAILKESSQRDTLVGRHATEKQGGTKELYLDHNAYELEQAAAAVRNAYYKEVTDRVFVMDMEQIYDVYKKFGNYVLTSATQESLQNEKNARVNWVDHYYRTDGKTEIPLDKPVEDSNQYVRNYLTRTGSGNNDYALIGIGYVNVGSFKPSFGSSGNDNLDITGVRPACYVDMSKTTLVSGSGTKADPYRFAAKNIYGNMEVEKLKPVRIVGMWSQFIKFTESSGAPFIDGANRTQVPLRVTMENYGAKVNWESVTKTAVVEKSGIKVEVPIGKSVIYVNGQERIIDTAAQIVAGRTYLPIKAVIEALGGSVAWDQATKTVIIK